MYINGPETRQCPKEFQDRITRMFGTTPFGDPIFKIVWGQSQFIRMGNVWRDVHGNERRGFRERYQSDGQPGWIIMRWRSASEYGNQDSYYAQTWDEYSQLHFLGEYPWRGRYEMLQALRTTEMVNGKLVVDHLPLTHILIDKILPMFVAAQSLSADERKAAQDLARKEKHKREVDEVAEQMMEALPAWYGPVSLSNQGCRTSLLDRKMYAIQKQWDRLTKKGRRPDFARGFAQGPAPRVI